jgi:endonuclease YncB( thermonuclease family)
MYRHIPAGYDAGMRTIRAILSGLLLLPLASIGFAPLGASLAAELSGDIRVLDGDTIEIGGQRVQLFGIVAPQLESHCQVAGNTIPCGRVSRGALLDLTAGAKVVCKISANAGTAMDPVARCQAGGYDLSEGMTYTGWARADLKSSDYYLRFEEDARRQHRGLWRVDNNK